ncbi:MAG: murein biosynthesis integral membrane protein MurJ [Ruminococcaceae bacterium]|nr:murein biosynthesis integral membrane protein MurJ [Oscillospiraceae bacterium]
MQTKGEKLMKSALFMVVATLFAKALGLLRDMLVAAAFGTSVSAIAFDAASRLPILLFDLVIGGVVTAAFIPIFNELLVKDGREKAFEFADHYVTLILVITIIIALLGVLFAAPLVEFLIPDAADEAKELAVGLTRIMFPMIVFTGLAFSFVGVLLSLGEFRIPAIISLVSNGVMVIYLFTLNNIFGVVGLGVSMLFGWFMQAFVQIPRLNFLGYRYRIRLNLGSPHIKEAAKGALPILIGTWTGPVCALINTRFASAIEQGRAVTALGYANRFYTIIIGVFSYVATNLLFPYISKAAAGGEKKEANRLMISSVRILMLVIMPITVGIFMLSEPLVSLIYERGAFTQSDVAMTATALRFYTLGMAFSAANEVLTKAFFARKEYKVPMYASLCAMCVNFALVFYFAKHMGIGGIALASGIAVAASCVFNYVLLSCREKELFVFSDVLALIKMAVSALVMGALVYFSSLSVSGNLLKLIVGVMIGAVAYFICCAILRVDEVKYLINKVKSVVFKK